MYILTINAGSSSIKYKLFNNKNAEFELMISGLIEAIGEKMAIWHHHADEQETLETHFATHQQAFAALAEKLQDLPIEIIGHRVVHGGNQYSDATIIDNHVLETIEHLSALAPIHNPVNAEGIHFGMTHFPKARQVAVFDTAFHQTMPEHCYRYAIEKQTADHYAIRRYGFHGINHHYVALKAAEFLNKDLSDCDFISLHLGNGASACLVKNGQSYDTSMGMTPLAGLIMGTRCGDIDPSIPLYLQNRGLELAEVDKLLNKKSGLLGIGENNDMRQLSEAAPNHKNAELAINMFVYAIQKYIAAYLSQTAKLDALIFTGGIGENASNIREKILASLGHLGFHLNLEKNKARASEQVLNISEKGYPLLLIKGDEERLIAEQAALKCLAE